MPAHFWRELHQRAGEDIGDDQVEWRCKAHGRVMEARGRLRLDARSDAVLHHIVLRHRHGHRIDIRRQNRNGGKLGNADGQHGAAGAQIQRIARMFAADDFADHVEAAGGGAVVAGAEGKTGVDLDTEIVDAARVAVVRAVHEEPSRTHRREAFERMGDPIDIGYLFALHVELDGMAAQDIADARLDLVGLERIDRDVEDFRILVHFESGNRQAILFEGELQQVEHAVGFDLASGEEQAGLGHRVVYFRGGL